MAKTKDEIQQLQQAFKHVFAEENPSAVQVLEDLARFCRADSSCFHEDPRLHALLEGRREVYLRIKDFINLTPDEYWAAYGKVNK